MISFLCFSGFANNVSFHCQFRDLGSEKTEDIRRMQKETMNNRINGWNLAGGSSQDSTRLAVHDRQSNQNVETTERLAAGQSAFGRL
jgi:hypothetical protein